jgi:predicted DNA-binding transcriptional regulator AlpA
MVLPMTDSLIGTTEAAARCGVERSTFFRWMQVGKITAKAKMPGATGALLFDPAEVDALAEAS